MVMIRKLTWLLCLGLATALAQEEARIVRVSAPLAIDGEDRGWPAAPPVLLKSPDGQARMRFACDGTAFYAFAEVEDSSPLMNGADRPEELIGGGDAVAFYFRSAPRDAQRVAVGQRDGKVEIEVYRPVSEVKRPYVFRSPAAETVFDYVAPLAGATARLRKRDGKGYVIEVALPWKSLGFAAAPERFDFDAQILFSDPGGTQTVGGAWLFAREGSAITFEDLPTMARLYPATWGKARVVAEVEAPAAGPSAATVSDGGANAIEINLPRAGRLSLNITEPGGWILRELVAAEPFAAGPHRIVWDGRDRYGEPLPPGDYAWRALLFDGMRTAFMGSVGNSGRPPYRTEDGLGSMGGQHGFRKSVAADAGGVYMANALQEGPPVLRKIDPATGRALWQRSAGSFMSVENVAAGEGMACILNGHGKKGDYACDLVRIDPASGRDVPMGAGPARVALDDAKGKPELPGLAIAGGKAWFSLPTLNTIGVVDLRTGKLGKGLSVPEPLGLARLDAATLLVCSGTSVLAVDVRSGTAAVRIAGLEKPRGVAVDAAGCILVSELGTSQRVKKFSPDGKTLLAAWGKEGGKSNQQIPYDPMAFRNVTGIAVGPRGNIWLAEADPLVRRFVKLDAGGGWVEDFYGPVAYNTFGPDLDDFNTLYYTIYGGCFNEVAIDYDQYRNDPMQPAKAWHIRAVHDMGLAADGKTVNELMRDAASTGYGHVIVFKGENGHRYFFRPSKHNRAAIPPGAGLWIEKNGRWVPCAFVAADPRKHACWADRNGDGLVQPDEEYRDLPVTQVAWIDRDLTLHGFAGKLSPASVNAAGAPVYAGGTFRPWLGEGETSYVGNQWTFFSAGYGDTVYYISNHGPHRHLSFWDRASENRLIKIEGGKVQWIAGTHAPRPGFTEFSTSSGVAGMVDGIVLVQNVEPSNYIAYTQDGFVLGDIMVDENGQHPKVGPYVINIESFTGLYLKDPKTGKNMLFAVSSGDDRVLEVTGPGRTDRLNGTVALRRASSLGKAPPAIPYSTWYGNTYTGLGVDGDDTEWRPDVRATSLECDGQVVADVRMRRDAGTLYLIAHVLDRDMAAGSGIELVLSDDVRGGSREEFAFILQSTGQGGWRIEPTHLRGGERAPTTGIESAVSMRWRGLGYRIEAGIPLSLLPGLSERREQTFRRLIKAKKELGEITESLPDLRAPVFVQIRVHRTGGMAALAAGDALVPATLR